MKNNKIIKIIYIIYYILYNVSKRLYKSVDYPQIGMEHGMFYSKSPGRAAQ